MKEIIIYAGSDETEKQALIKKNHALGCNVVQTFSGQRKLTHALDSLISEFTNFVVVKQLITEDNLYYWIEQVKMSKREIIFILNTEFASKIFFPTNTNIKVIYTDIKKPVIKVYSGPQGSGKSKAIIEDAATPFLSFKDKCWISSEVEIEIINRNLVSVIIEEIQENHLEYWINWANQLEFYNKVTFYLETQADVPVSDNYELCKLPVLTGEIMRPKAEVLKRLKKDKAAYDHCTDAFKQLLAEGKDLDECKRVALLRKNLKYSIDLLEWVLNSDESL